jgi:hypothetical protein
MSISTILLSLTVKPATEKACPSRVLTALPRR